MLSRRRRRLSGGSTLSGPLVLEDVRCVEDSHFEQSTWGHLSVVAAPSVSDRRCLARKCDISLSKKGSYPYLVLSVLLGMGWRPALNIGYVTSNFSFRYAKHVNGVKVWRKTGTIDRFCVDKPDEGMDIIWTYWGASRSGYTNTFVYRECLYGLPFSDSEIYDRYVIMRPSSVHCSQRGELWRRRSFR